MSESGLESADRFLANLSADLQREIGWYPGQRPKIHIGFALSQLIVCAALSSEGKTG